MIINKITLKNFFRFGNEQILNLEGSGITGIVGLNGNGKSSLIIDSLLFALYGKYRCDTIDGVVNRYIGKDCKVGVEFTVDGEQYKVLRYRKHTVHNNNVYLFKGDKDISGHTAAETNNLIIDLIKMPYIAFINSCVFSSELYSAFLANKVSERLIVFENILSLKEISTFYVEIKKILKELNDSLSEKNITLASMQSEKNTISSTIDTYSKNAKTKLLSMKSEKDLAKKTIETANEKIKEFSIINIEVERNKLGNTSLRDEYSSRVLKLEKELSELTVSIPAELKLIVEKYKNVNFEENKLLEEKYKEDLETMRTRENGYQLSFQNLDNIKQKSSSIISKNNSYKEEKGDLINKLSELSKQICPFCGQHLTSNKAEEEKQKANKRLNDIEKELEENEKELEDLKAQFKEESENYNFLLGDYNRIKESLNKNFVPNTDLIKEQYMSASKRLDEIQELSISNSLKRKEVEKEISGLNDKISKLEISNYSEEELNSISSKIEEQKNIISENEKKIVAIDASVTSVYDKKYIEDLKKHVEDCDKKITDFSLEVSKVNDDIKHYNFLADCFSNKSGGFKKYFIGEMIELFNERINQYLPFFFTEKVRIEFDKDLNDTITMDDFVVGFSSFSQGQRQRAELAINFALFDVARVFFSNDNKLLILDEMDKGLDKFGIRSMINLLNGFDKQLRIFIVSHNPLLDEEVDSKIKIERDENGFSKIVI